MRTQLAPFVRDTSHGRDAADIVRKCVHCGFCNATCPTYQLFGDELDGPRGRIYLIKQVLEGAEPTVHTQLHLDRCLGCRACETTCPSGVQYGRLLDIGQELLEEKVPRTLSQRIERALLMWGLTSRYFAPALRLGQRVRSMLPNCLRSKIPPPTSAGKWPTRSHSRQMLLLIGCVQPAMSPGIDAATARVLDAIGIQAITPPAACCGAIRHHLSDHEGALVQARRNIDQWWTYVERGVEAIVSNASGCGAMVKEYAHLLRHDAAYADRARRIVGLTRDLSEVLAESGPALERLKLSMPSTRVALHTPCTLQHAQRLRGSVETLLATLGAVVLNCSEGHLCCGSAGTYSLLQPEISKKLRDRKLAALMAQQPQEILSANVGCIAHLAGAARVPVRHWIEWVDACCTEVQPPPEQRTSRTIR